MLQKMVIEMHGMRLVKSIVVHSFLDTTPRKVIAASIALLILVMRKHNFAKVQTYGVSVKRAKKKFGGYKPRTGFGKLNNKAFQRLKNYSARFWKAALTPKPMNGLN